MKNEFYSEKMSSRIPKCTRKEYGEILLRHFDADNKNKTKVQEEYKLKGTKKYIGEGIADRLSARPYNFVSQKHQSSDSTLDKNTLTGDERSYYYGYYILATEKISLQIKYPDIKRLASFEEIGYNDAKCGIPLEDLPLEIKENSEYLMGYKKALEEISKNTKHSRK